MSENRQRLLSAGQAITTAIMVLRSEMPTFEAFLKECRDMQNFGHIVDPTLFNNSERRAVSALMEPLFKSAVEFVNQYEAHTGKAKAALDKVKT